MGFADDREDALLPSEVSSAGRAFVSVADGVVAVLPRDGSASTTPGSAQPPANDPAPSGNLLDGRYRVLRRLGRGLTGVQHQVVHLGNRRSLIAEVVSPQPEDALAIRFLRTAWVLSGITHPNVIAVLDFGETATGEAYCITPDLRGERLDTRMRVSNLSPRECLETALQLTRGLEAAHDAGLVHGQLRPATVFLCKDTARRRTTAILRDFGPSVECRRPEYLAPEQIRGDAVDGRADIYALGVVLFQMLTGRLPFQQKDDALLARDQLYEPPPSIHAAARRSTRLPATETLVSDLLAKAPSSRPATAAAAGRQIRNAIQVDFGPARNSKHRRGPTGFADCTSLDP